MKVDALGSTDLSAAHSLSTQAGWNQTRADWRRLIEHPSVEGFAGRVGGTLVATATVATYDGAATGDVGWVGMVLVEESHRRQGYGTTMLDRAMDWADARLDAVGLDATEYGRPLYEERGFEAVAPVDRWSGALEPRGGDVDVERVEQDDLRRVCAFDRRACGVDRSELLALLHAEDGTTCFAVTEADDVTGYAVLRPGREQHHLGPVVASDVDVRSSLLDAAARTLDGAPVLVDAPASAGADLSQRGLSVQRELTRMTHPRAERLLLSDDVVAITSFEWG